MQLAVLIVSSLVALLLAVVLIILLRPKDMGWKEELDDLADAQDRLRRDMNDGQARLRQELIGGVQNTVSSLGRLIGDNQQNAAEQQENRLRSFESQNEQKLEQIRETMERRLARMQADNNERLESMQQIVDEKLQKTLETRMTQSFQMVSERLEQVYKGLGEMQTLASGVGDLKKVLSNVKTRGILGEIQLEAILREILAPEQYAVNVATKRGSNDRVEFAIRLPADDGETIYLPIDSKFPGDVYAALQDAYDSGSSDQIRAAAAALHQKIKQEAKDIRDKYIDPPNTTEFAILFLPFEGLYAEVVNRGLVEELQRTYRVNVAGPSTMAALLNSLQMGFRTIAIQKRSGEVWQVLGAVKTEFEKFETVLKSSQHRLNQVNDELDKLIGTRTRSIMRSLRSVERMENEAASSLIGTLDYTMGEGANESDEM